MISAQLRMFVLHHREELLDRVEDRDYLHKVNLNELDVGRYQVNALCENRFYLSGLHESSTQDYIGLGSARWNAKYPLLPRLEALDKISSLLTPARVLVAARVGRRWARFSERKHPGILPYLQELSIAAGVPLLGGPAFWSNNFICHHSVFQQFIKTWREWFDQFHDKYGVCFDFQGGHTHARAAYFYERLTLLYFANRKDLDIVQLPRLKPHESADASPA